MSVSQNGWPALRRVPATYFTAPNGKRVYCANADVATVLGYVAQQWHDRIEKLPKATNDIGDPAVRKGRIVIHAYRPPGSTAGIGDASNHRSATGMDILGEFHHYERSCARGWCGWPAGRHAYISGFSAADIAVLRDIQRTVTDDRGRQILRFGQFDFQVGYRDGMHTEIAFGVTPAQVAQAARKLAKPAPQTPTPPRASTLRSFPASASRVGNQHALSGVIQWVVGRNRTGKVTAADVAAIKTQQRKSGVTADGVLGINTARAYLGAAIRLYGNLRRGATGQAVALLQYRIGVPLHQIDGVWGAQTDTHLANAQRAAGITPDRVFGPDSLTALFKS